MELIPITDPEALVVHTGLNDIYKVNYSIYNGLVSTDDAVAVSRGSYWNIAIGVKFAISNLWMKRD